MSERPITSDDIPKAGEPAEGVDLTKPMPPTRGDSGMHLDGRKGRVIVEGRPVLAEDTPTGEDGRPDREAMAARDEERAKAAGKGRAKG